MNQDSTTLRGTPSEAAADEQPGSVVVGVDGSEHARSAALWAAGEATRRGTALILANALYLSYDACVPPPSETLVRTWRQEARAMVEQEAGRLGPLFPGLSISAAGSDGRPAEFLTDLSENAALLVTGTRGHGGFVGMLVGSVGRRLAARARCPLVVVGADPPANPQNEVVLGVGLKPSPAAVRFAFDTAAEYGASLTVVRAWWPHAAYSITAPGGMYIDYSDDFRHSVLAEAGEAVEPVRSEYPDVEVNVAAEEGNAVPVLVNVSRRARLLVIGGTVVVVRFRSEPDTPSRAPWPTAWSRSPSSRWNDRDQGPGPSAADRALFD